MRLFIGIELPEHIRHLVAQEAKRLSSTIPGRYVLQDNYHITLAFLGEYDMAGAEAAKAVMKDAADGQSPFSLQLASPGFFGKQRNAILYIGTDDCYELNTLDERLCSLLADRNLRYDKKPFHSHITIARHAQISQDILSEPLTGVPPFEGNALTLFHSTRINNVLTYLPIARVPFAP